MQLIEHLVFLEIFCILHLHLLTRSLKSKVKPEIYSPDF